MNGCNTDRKNKVFSDLIRISVSFSKLLQPQELKSQAIMDPAPHIEELQPLSRCMKLLGAKHLMLQETGLLRGNATSLLRDPSSDERKKSPVYLHLSCHVSNIFAAK